MAEITNCNSDEIGVLLSIKIWRSFEMMYSLISYVLGQSRLTMCDVSEIVSLAIKCGKIYHVDNY